MGKNIVRIRPNFKRKAYGNIDEDAQKARDKFRGNTPIDPAKLKKYVRGKKVDIKAVKVSLKQQQIENRESKFEFSSQQSARAELLLTENSGFLEADEGEITAQFTQSDIVGSVDITSASKRFDLTLNFGPYRMNYTRNGRFLLLAGRKGHVAALDWVTKKLLCEINVMESTYDCAWLHQETMFAVAQKKWVYIYDNSGMEIHCIKKLDNVFKLEFLPYHFLLACVSTKGFISWLDVSIGKMVEQFHISSHGSVSTVAQCPSNALICVGQPSGLISLYSPNDKKPVVTKWCHKQPLSSIAFDPRGEYLATACVDRSMKLWDARQLSGPVQEYLCRSVPHCLGFSHKGCLAMGLGNIVEVYKNAAERKAYLRHKLYKTISNFQFCPYEDILGIGHYEGFSSILVPGSGEPNFDALEANPFQSKSQRREAEIQALLGKIPSELITWDSNMLQKVHTPSLSEIIKDKKNAYEKPPKIEIKLKNKNTSSVKKALTKKIMKEDAKREYFKSLKESEESDLMEEDRSQNTTDSKPKSVLDRFLPKPDKKNKS